MQYEYGTMQKSNNYLVRTSKIRHFTIDGRKTSNGKIDWKNCDENPYYRCKYFSNGETDAKSPRDCVTVIMQ